MKQLFSILLVVAVVVVAQSPGAAAEESPADRILNAASRSARADRAEAFRQGLRELGYAEGKNIFIEYR